MPRQPGATGPDTGLRLPKILVIALIQNRDPQHRVGNAKFPGKFVWIFVGVFGLVLGFLLVCFGGGVVCIFVWFRFSLVFFFLFFFSLIKISFIASSTSHLWNMPYQFSIQIDAILLQLTVGFRQYMFLIMITSWLNCCSLEKMLDF